MLKNKKMFDVISVHKAPFIVGVITVLCLSLFVNKAFHLDDPLFIWSAKQINAKPLDFYGFNVNWYGRISRMAEVTQNPPFSCYYIAIVSVFLGYSEIALHIAFLFPAVAAALGTYYLAKKFCSQPILAALAAVLTPGFLVSSTNIMCDTMMVAFWVWAVYYWIKGIEQNKAIKLFIAALLIICCALTKYYGIALLPLLFVYTIIKKRNVGIWLLFLLIPVLCLAGYQWYTHNMYGRGLISNAANYALRVNPSMGLSWFARAVLTGFFFTGGCIASVFFFFPVFLSKRNLSASIGLTILFMLIPIFLNITGDNLKDSLLVKIGFLIQAGLMGSTGVVIIWLTIKEFWENRNAELMMLALWIIGTFVFAAFMNWAINIRSILPMIPAVGILLVRQLESVQKRTNLKIWSNAWPLIPSAALAILVCLADYSWADLSRVSAASISKTFKDNSKIIWFEGHWGFQYYMESLGYYPLDFQKPMVQKSDMIVIPENNTNLQYLPAELVAPVEVYKFQAFRFLATMNTKIGAGFYMASWGSLPFAFGPVAPEEFYIYIVK